MKLSLENTMVPLFLSVSAPFCRYPRCLSFFSLFFLLLLFFFFSPFFFTKARRINFAPAANGRSRRKLFKLSDSPLPRQRAPTFMNIYNAFSFKKKKKKFASPLRFVLFFSRERNTKGESMENRIVTSCYFSS